MFREAGEAASRRLIEFFVAVIRNRNTREAYGRAVRDFCDWCEERNIGLRDISPFLVAAYIEELGTKVDRPSVKQKLAALKMLFDWLVTGQILPVNPAASVRGPKHVVTVGRTPVLTAEEARQLLDSIDVSTITGKRDRALIATMLYTFARIGAVTAMDIEDYEQRSRRMWINLREKGGKRHAVPAHHTLEEYLDDYVSAAGIGHETKTPLFRSLNRKRQLTTRRIHRREVLAMVKRRARKADLSGTIGCHTMRATGITAYLSNGGLLEHAQRIAAHASSQTTRLYDRRSDAVSLDEVERIVI
jgi:site-specific recombinase XerD